MTLRELIDAGMPLDAPLVVAGRLWYHPIRTVRVADAGLDKDGNWHRLDVNVSDGMTLPSTTAPVLFLSEVKS